MQKELRKSGIAKIGEIPFGSHLCQFYQTKEDLLEILVPYFKAGLEGNEYCMWVTSPPLSAEDAARAMRVALPDFDRFRDKKQIEIVPHDQWYLKDGAFESQRVLDAWIEKHDRARSMGFDGLRLTGNTAWLEKETWRDFTEYEEEVDEAIRNYNMLAVCTYALDRCQASQILDVVKNHESALIMRAGKWEAIQNSGRRRVEQELLDSEEVYRSLTESSPNAITMSGLDGKIIQANHRAAEMLGLESEEEMIGTSGYDLVVPEEREGFQKRLLASFRDGVSDEIDFTFIDGEGRRRMGEFIASILADAQGKPRAVMTTVRDITKQKQAENALRESESRYRTLYESVPVGIGLATLDGQILAINQAMCRITGYTEEEWKKTNVLAIYQNPDERALFKKRFKDGRVNNFEARLKRADGEPYIANLTSTSINMGGKTALLTVVEDITERKRAEKQLQSLASQLSLAEEKERRRIATELHDDVGQILAIAKMKLSALREKQSTAGLKDAVGELKTLCEQAIAFTRSLTSQLSPPALYELGLEPAVEVLIARHRDYFGIDTDFTSDREPKPLDDDIRVLLFQSIRELLNNIVRHARASRTTVSITRESDSIRVAVEDNGAGFDTSAQRDNGAFGLFNIKERLLCLGGTFSLRSSPGQGTRIVITAPLKSEEDAGGA